MTPHIWKIPNTYKVTGGRDKGRRLREAILTELLTLPPDTTLLLDFGAVETLDFSAADEIVDRLIGRVLSREMGTRRFALTGIGESARESIVAVLELRRRQCLEISGNGRMRVLGPLSPVHEETLQFVAKRGEVSVADVAEHFGSGLRMSAATNRLNTLANAGLVVRRAERGGPRGNRLVYTTIVSSRRQTVAAKSATVTKSKKRKGGQIR